jgi:glutamate racemase
MTNAHHGAALFELQDSNDAAPLSFRDGPIGIFDSGVGGTSVLREVRALLPGESLLYLADQAHCPYGPRSMAELQVLCEANTRWLLARSAKLIVVACNTASAAALTHLRATFPEVAFVGMVPAVKPAAQTTRTGVVGLLATPTTMQGTLLAEVVATWAQDVRVIPRLGYGLVEAVEAGALTTPETRTLVASHLTPLLAEGADVIVLGCTHYPFLAPVIRELAGPGVLVLDAGEAVARQTARLLAAHQLGAPPGRPAPITYATTGNLARYAATLQCLEVPPGRVISAQE